jgi:polysaccharide deacetylase 2 family uncharacterized protein YibQ
VKARRLFLPLFFVAALIGAGVYSAKWFPGADGSPDDEALRIALDSAETAAWTKAHPWMFRDTALADFRETLLLPFAVENSLGPRRVRRRGEHTELTFPRDRPVHAIAYELETRAVRARFRIVEGREVGSAANQVEYLLRDASGRTFALRLLLGQVVSAGSFRMALVITDLGRASESDRRAWLDFPLAVTLVFPDTITAPDRKDASGAERSVLVELPMEPAAFPVVKPGPRALFIDNTREETDRILRVRLESNPGAAGFATKHGDRAIENPALMESVLAFTAERGLLFLDLTGSSRSLTPQMSLRTGAESFTAVGQEPGSVQTLEAELARRAAVAKRSGEGIWVMRHAPGLPATLARVLRAPPHHGETAPRWVTLKRLHRPEE